jgi:hypothetical protein
VRRVLLLLAAASLLAGCVRPVNAEFVHLPTCDTRVEGGNLLVLLMAQAVPSASQIPCVELLPTGWSVGEAFVRNGRARFALDSDRVGDRAVEVILERTCSFGRVTRVPSDHEGTRRYQEVIAIESGRRYRGAVHYLFPGGCVTYRLDFRSDEQARPLGEVDLALGFVSREVIRKLFSDYSDGRVQLDPPAEAG